MSEMVERAARAMCEVHHGEVCVGVSLDEYWEQCRDTFGVDARAALLAALDPEDEALRKALLSAMGFYCEPGLKFSASAHDQARAAIAALKAAAQGETVYTAEPTE